jgi:hypothetical protein
VFGWDAVIAICGWPRYPSEGVKKMEEIDSVEVAERRIVKVIEG